MVHQIDIVVLVTGNDREFEPKNRSHVFVVDLFRYNYIAEMYPGFGDLMIIHISRKLT